MTTGSFNTFHPNTVPGSQSPELETLLGLSPRNPDWRMDIMRAADFIMQINGQEPAAKHGCALAAQLNAHIAVGELDPTVAMEVQDDLVNDPQYDPQWSPPMFGPDRTWRAWSSHPSALRSILRKDYGVAVQAPRYLTSRDYDLPTEAERHLWRGGVAFLSGVRVETLPSGETTVAEHARIAFEPAGFTPRQLFVHDAHFPETTGIYDQDALRYLQLGKRIILYDR